MWVHRTNIGQQCLNVSVTFSEPNNNSSSAVFKNGKHITKNELLLPFVTSSYRHVLPYFQGQSKVLFEDYYRSLPGIQFDLQLRPWDTESATEINKTKDGSAALSRKDIYNIAMISESLESVVTFHWWMHSNCIGVAQFNLALTKIYWKIFSIFMLLSFPRCFRIAQF